MIGMIGILGGISAAAAVATAVCAAVAAATAVVSAGISGDASAAAKTAQKEAEAMQEKQLALQKFQTEKKQLRTRRAAATGTLASIVEAKKNKYRSDAAYRNLTRLQSSTPIVSHARVNRATYNYGTPVRS